MVIQSQGLEQGQCGFQITQDYTFHLMPTLNHPNQLQLNKEALNIVVHIIHVLYKSTAA